MKHFLAYLLIFIVILAIYLTYNGAPIGIRGPGKLKAIASGDNILLEWKSVNASSYAVQIQTPDNLIWRDISSNIKESSYLMDRKMINIGSGMQPAIRVMARDKDNYDIGESQVLTTAAYPFYVLSSTI